MSLAGGSPAETSEAAIRRILSVHINSPNLGPCLDLLDQIAGPLRLAPGSRANHQWWAGGYLDHVAEVLRVAVAIYPSLNAIHDLPFALADAVLVLFLHDIEKPWKYEAGVKLEKHDNHMFRVEKAINAGIFLNAELLNGMKYVEGEGDDYTPGMRVMGPLAAFCHMCDVCSARIWFDQPAQDVL